MIRKPSAVANILRAQSMENCFHKQAYACLSPRLETNYARIITVKITNFVIMGEKKKGYRLLLF